MKFTINVKCDNAAFGDNDDDEVSSDAASEVGRILGKVKKDVESGFTQGIIYDLNGGKVGGWYFS